jgi:hypothetical protein
MTSIPLSELQSSPAAKFDAVGATFVGRITNLDKRANTDPVTGQVKTFQSGDVMYVWVITIEQDNGESVALWASGGKYVPASGQGESMLSAIGTAVRASEAGSVDVGGRLGVRHTGLGEAKPGLNAPKLYQAQYEPPAPSAGTIPADDLFAS